MVLLCAIYTQVWRVFNDRQDFYAKFPSDSRLEMAYA